MAPTPHVTLHVWQVRRRDVPRALSLVATDPRRLAGTPGLRWARTLGTGSASSFSPRQATPTRWALLASWDTAGAAGAAGAAAGGAWERWQHLAQATWQLDLTPLQSRGRWGGATPFGDPVVAASPPGPVLAVTRARVRLGQWRRFAASTGPVADDLRGRDGLLTALGVGEAPVGLQGTVSLWRDHRALADFAWQGAAHTAAIRRTHELGWYAEELFARFAVAAEHGTRPIP